MKVLWILPVFVLLNFVNSQLSGRCFTPDSFSGNCVAIDECPPLLEIIKQRPLHREKLSHLRRSQCGFENRRVLVCCPTPGQQTIPTVATTVGPPSSIKNNLLPSPGECGVHPEDSIYGGNDTVIDEYSWMVLLEYSKPNNRKGFHCGGVLINKRYVLTASHCVNGKDLPSSWTLTSVRLGEWDTATSIDCEKYADEEVCNDPALDIPIEEKIVHENYNPQAPNQFNDIALLRLSKSVEYTQFIRPICLPLDSDTQSSDFVKERLTVAGWGYTEHGTVSTRKLKVNIDGVSNADCQKTYSSRSLVIDDSQICAGGEYGYDSCRGDSGGPLMSKNNLGSPPHWILIGLVSFGRTPCGQLGWPGVHTKVGKFVPWIEANIKP